MWRVIEVLVCAVAIALLIAATALTTVFAEGVVEGKNRVQYYFGYRPVVVVSGSMEPVIRTNSVSIVKQAKIEDINKGDIVMYMSKNGIPVMHRVVGFTEINGRKALITKGDANREEDFHPVTDDMLCGKTVLTINSVAPVLSRLMPDYTKVTPAYSLKVAILTIILLAVVIKVFKWWTLVSMAVWRAVFGGSNAAFSAAINKYEESISNILSGVRFVDNMVTYNKKPKRLIDSVRLELLRMALLRRLRCIKKNERGIGKIIYKIGKISRRGE